MDRVPSPYNTLKPHLKRRSVPYPTSPRMPESPLKPTSSLRHRRQSSTVISAGLFMSPTSCNGDSESRENVHVEAASRSLGGGIGERRNEDEELGRIAQAMTLLSLHPTDPGRAIPREHTSTSLTPWPSPEELLKESLRQSLSALHALGRIKSLVGDLPGSGEREDEEEEGEGEGGIAQIMGFYDRAVGEMRAAGEVLTWAQQYLSEEKEAVRERLLKG